MTVKRTIDSQRLNINQYRGIRRVDVKMIGSKNYQIDKSDVLVLLSLLSLTAVFYVIDVKRFLENLSYAVLALLSLCEAIKIITKSSNKRIES